MTAAMFKREKFRIKSKIFLLDSTTISICLSLFDWTRYKTAKKVDKMHTLFDFDGKLPAYVNITEGKTADNKGAYDIPLLKWSVIVADRFYNDFSLLNIWDRNEVFSWNKRKRCNDPNMDRTDNYTDAKSIKGHCKIQLAFFKSGCFYTIYPFCEN